MLIVLNSNILKSNAKILKYLMNFFGSKTNYNNLSYSSSFVSLKFGLTQKIYGTIGTYITQFLHAFNTKILVCDPNAQLFPKDTAASVGYISLDQLLSASDVVILHQRVSPETTLMVNKDTLSQMKPNVLFISTAGGSLCNYDNLYEVLNDGTFSPGSTLPYWR
ncbi:MAG: hypothetical protein OXC62_06495 [Aestuariivita sp.]|nr:hypothetical protein [Aestuariivita sp.]